MAKQFPPPTLNPYAPMYIPCFHTLIFHYLPPPPPTVQFGSIYRLKIGVHSPINPKPTAEKVGPPRRELRGEPRPKKRGPAPTTVVGGSGLFGTTTTTTTVMIKNVPSRIKRDELLKILDQKGPASSGSLSYDFVYLPMDFTHHANYGYAFVNFTTAEAARLFRRAFHNLVWSSLGYRTKKICHIAPAKTQGKEALMNRFKGSVFRCCSDEYLPVVLSPPPSGSRPVLTVIGKRLEPKPIIG